MNFSAPSLSTPSFGAPSMPSMPSAPENPLSDAQMEEIKTECKEFLDKFGKAYLASYKASLIAKVKQDLKGTEPSPFKLKTAPDHAEPEVVMSGFLTKRGEVFKNWKKRVFVLKSNGGCQYFVKEGDSKAKGAIGLEGYSVNAEPTTDIFSGKQFVFTLEHSDEEKRVWYLFADGEEEKQEWVLAFKQACRVAEGYVNPDKIVRGAFASAYAKLRRAYGMWPKKPRGPEQEALTDVLYERVYDKILRDALRNVDGIPKKLAIKAAKVSVSAAVTAAWKGFDQATDKIRPGIEGTLKKAMGPFVEGEQRVKTKIQESVGEKVINPIVERSLVPFFQQVVSILYPVIVEALSLQLSISIDACKQAGGDLKDSQNASQVFKGLKKTLDIKPALKKLPMKNISQWEKNVDQILAVVGKLDSVGNFASSLKTDINDNIKPAVHTIFPGSIEESMLGLVKNTLYTFEEDFKESNGPDAANRTLSKLNYDLSLIFEQIVQDSLKELVSGPFEEQVQGPADELIAPIADEIPEDLKDFIDPQALLDDVLDQTLDDAISTATGPGVSKLTEQLNTTLTSKGIELLSVSD